ncbi:MAG TPA: sigma-54 dependent transcriptional regulator [Myxococcaceae bacterium]|nr:sigma-54 dependent transcriptional regulator [Myxococcaceae bacterium]
MPESILVVEDEEPLRRNIARYLEREGYRVLTFSSAEEVLPALGDAHADVALVDVRLPGQDGLSLIGELLASRPDLLAIVMTAYGTVESAVEALHAGAHDYVLKPLLLHDVAHRIRHLLERRALLRENAALRRSLAEREPADATCQSRAMSELQQLARRLAASTSTVLIQGESGSGKEVLARFIHQASPRRDKPFLAVNVAAIPESLLESHLFGHEKGAFTGATGTREGFFRAASGGTLFLDEIGELPLPHQAKLLRAIEGKEVIPVGAERPLVHDARILAATNCELARAVEQRTFRSDLYYRLSALKLRVPPLRERPEDVPGLVRALLERHARSQGLLPPGVDPRAMRRLLAYGWPGNVRELSNALERAIVLSAGRDIQLEDLPPELAVAPAEGAPYHQAMADFERALVRSTLEQAGGDRRAAARLLGISLATLYRRLERLDLRPSPGQGEA